jgi:hypothetical protein
MSTTAAAAAAAALQQLLLTATAGHEGEFNYVVLGSLLVHVALSHRVSIRNYVNRE